MKNIILSFILLSSAFFSGIAVAQTGDGFSEKNCRLECVELDPQTNTYKIVNCDQKNNNAFVVQRFVVDEHKDGTVEVSKYCVGFQESIPIGKKRVVSVHGKSGVDLVANYVGMVYKFGGGLIGLIAVLVIVISGVQIIAGGANPEGVSAAKTRILQALLSLVLLFSSAMLLKAINPNFFS
ncbi:hypothetical protein HC823_00820 [Candidatus Gracilibacteria bacterium]|nr:hypothetical protein [Candidatus Gracilibacteria bacterium]